MTNEQSTVDKNAAAAKARVEVERLGSREEPPAETAAVKVLADAAAAVKVVADAAAAVAARAARAAAAREGNLLSGGRKRRKTKRKKTHRKGKKSKKKRTKAGKTRTPIVSPKARSLIRRPHL